MLSEFYFDNAATTIISEKALKAYSDCALEFMGNPSANHREGQKAHERLEEERKQFADTLSVKSNQIFFTSGATESISIVLSSLLWAKTPGEIIISKIEHEAVSSWSGILKEKGWTIKTLKAKGGFVSPQELEESITASTRLVAIMLVNNVTGAIQD
ncbi:MAG: aminotransferase class V-fold PLP-dependent enzyme, partial [Sphaerochaetaceae bacterium]|nr:aminotransferase class V-fold PLP-dependent enzyme [Sphaerochaetaceae bacterium]